MIAVQNVTKRYGSKVVVDDVSFQIEKGKLTSIIGPNGAGKSTLLSMMTQLLPRDEGQILLDGLDITESRNRELAKKISILRQDNHTNVRLTVRELISFGRFPYSQGRLTDNDWLHVERALDYMALKPIENRYLDQLSGGQRQLSYLAMVLCQDTEYVLLDEPLNNLDMKHSVDMMRVLRQMVDGLGKTVVIVIHDINFASCHSDNIVALKGGKLVHQGAVDQIITPQTLHEIYDLDIHIETIEGNRIGVYFS